MNLGARAPFLTIVACAALALCTALGVGVYASRKRAQRDMPAAPTDAPPNEISVE